MQIRASYRTSIIAVEFVLSTTPAPSDVAGLGYFRGRTRQAASGVPQLEMMFVELFQDRCGTLSAHKTRLLLEQLRPTALAAGQC